MTIVAWIVLGLLSGLIASVVFKGSGLGIVGDLVLGLIGAVVGGFLMNLIGHSGPNGVNLPSIAVSVLGAIIVLFIYRALTRRGTSV